MTKGTYIRTQEIKSKNSKSRKEKGFGRCGIYIRTDEIKEKQRQKMIGRKASLETIQKLINSHIGKTLGKKMECMEEKENFV